MKVKAFFEKYGKKTAILTFVVLCVLAGGYFYLKSRQAQPVQKEEKAFTVKTMKVSPTGSDVYLNYSGLVQPEKMEQATVATVGEIAKINVKEGDKVAKGQVLFSLDTTTAQQQANAAYQSTRAAESAMNGAKTARDAAQRAYDAAAQTATQEQKDAAAKTLADATKTRDDLQKEIDRIDTLTQPQKAEVDTAQANLTQKQQEFDAAQEKANGEDATEEDQQNLETARQAVYDAQSQLDTKNLALVTEQEKLGRSQKVTQLTTANASVTTAQAEVDRLNSMGTGGGNIDTLKTQLDSANYNYESSKSAYESAKANYEVAKRSVDECTYRAQMSGKVVKMVGTEGGLATPLAPVLVVGSNAMVVQFGVSQSDMRDVKPGQKAIISISGTEYNGTVKDVTPIPDQTTRTYTTNVLINNAPVTLNLGEIAFVKISLGEKTGVWLPLSVIMNDGQDYIYAVENNRATRKNIVIADINNDMVRVTGLDDGAHIISEGMKTVKSGNLVHIMSEE